MFDSYAPGALKQDGFTFEHGTITLTSGIPASNIICVKFEYVPEIVIKSGVDYFEVPSYPSIVFERIFEVARRGFIMQDNNSYGQDSIRDKENNVAVQQKSPTQKSYRFQYAAFTNLQLDQFRLSKDLNAFFANTKQLTMWGLGNKTDLDVVEELDTARNSGSDDSDTNTEVGSFDILGALFYDKESIDLNLVTDSVIEVKIV